MIVTDLQVTDARSDKILARATEIIDKMWEEMIVELEAETMDVNEAVEGVVLPSYLTAVTNIKLRIEKLVAGVGGQVWQESPVSNPEEGN